MARIQAEDRGAIFDENGEMVGEADEGSQMGDPMDMEMDLDPIDEVEEEEGGEDEQTEEAVPEGEGEGDGAGEGEEIEGGNESLFLPGAASP